MKQRTRVFLTFTQFGIRMTSSLNRNLLSLDAEALNHFVIGLNIELASFLNRSSSISDIYNSHVFGLSSASFTSSVFDIVHDSRGVVLGRRGQSCTTTREKALGAFGLA